MKKKFSRINNNSITKLMDELDLIKVKDLDSGFNGDTFIVKNKKDELFVFKLERQDAVPSNNYDKNKPNYESEYDRQIDFDKLVAQKHPDKFMVLENYGIITDCVFTHSKTDEALVKTSDKRKERFIRKNKQPNCYYLIYKPILDGTYKSVSAEIKNDKKLLLDFLIQIISSINIYRNLGFIHTDVNTSNIMFKKIDGKYQWYWIDYGNITNNKYPDSYLDIERKEFDPNVKTNMIIDLIMLITRFCITSDIFSKKIKSNEQNDKEFMEKIYDSDNSLYAEIIEYFPNIDYQNNIKYLLFVLIFKILYPSKYAKYYNIEYDNKEQILKDELLLCIKHSNDKTYDYLLEKIIS